MERKKHLLIIVLLINAFLLFSPILRSDNTIMDKSFKERIYLSYINGNMVGWENIVKEIENSSKTENSSQSYSSQTELVSYYYGLTGYLISQKEKKKALGYISKGDAIIDEILSQNPKDALFTAYRAAFMGFKIGLNNLKAMTLGMKSAQLSKDAFLKDSLNAQVVTERANVLYYSPSFAGGDKKEAMRLYKKAVGLLEQKAETVNNWFYLSLLTNIARLEESQKNYSAALSLYKKILTIEPNYKWVKNDLYPSLQSRF